MEENVKNLWLSKIKSGKVAVIESHYAPNNTNCIWLKDGVMYVFGNSGWETLGGGSSEGCVLIPAKESDYPVNFTLAVSQDSGSIGGFRGTMNFYPIPIEKDGDEDEDWPIIYIKMKDGSDYSWDFHGCNIRYQQIDQNGTKGFSFNFEGSGIMREFPDDSGVYSTDSGINNPTLELAPEIGTAFVYVDFANSGAHYKTDDVEFVKLCLSSQFPNNPQKWTPVA